MQFLGDDNWKFYKKRVLHERNLKFLLIFIFFPGSRESDSGSRLPTILGGLGVGVARKMWRLHIPEQ